MMKINHFQRLLSSYFLKYIPERKNYSENTIKSYRDAFILLFQFQESYIQKSVTKLSFETISKKYIEDFLIWLESEKKYSVSSINQRLSVIHAFFEYVQMENPEYIELCTSIIGIKTRKVPEKPMNYLSVESIKVLFNFIDTTNVGGRRELALLTLLYDSGARVQEIADLTFGDIRHNKSATVKLKGKGNKTRIIPIIPQTMVILNDYIDDCKKKVETKPTAPLFFNKRFEKLTRAGISYILNKYIKIAKETEPELFVGKISAHSLRHSKAMHLLEGGVNLVYIRDFLGHKSVITTEVYAKSNPEIKRKAIEEVSPNVLPLERYSESEKQDMLKWLKTII